MKMRKRRFIPKALISLPLITALFLTQNANAVPISAGFVGTNNAKGQLGFIAQDINADYVNNSGKIPGADVKYTLNYSLLAGAWSMTDDLQFGALLPYLHSYFRGSAAPIAPGFFLPVSITKKGLGDPSLAVAYTFYRKNGLGYVSSMSATIGMGFPLGSYDDKATPRALQPGSGNFVPSIGASYFFQSATLGMAVVNVSYFKPLMRNGYQFPSNFNYNLAFSYPIYPFTLQSSTYYPVTWNVHLEFLGTKTGQAHATNPFLNGFDANTGGNLIKCAPGISVEGVGWNVEAQYLFPISQSLNGIQALKFGQGFIIAAGFQIAGLG
jgi:hypothetical protein